MLGTYCTAVGHIFHLHIIRVFSCTEYFLPDIHTECGLPDAEVFSALQSGKNLLFSAKHLSCQVNSFDNLLISRATANISANGFFNILFRRIRILINKRLRTHHHTGNAETALHGTAAAEGIDIGLLLFNT